MDENNPAAALPSALAGHPWRKHTAKLENPPPTMLKEPELNLLHWLAAKYYRGEGAIIDGGCFLGGSTCALASGLAENPLIPKSQRPIHSYDIFSTAGDLWFDWLTQHGLNKGESFEDRFRQNVGPHLDRVEIHAGDLLRQSWGDAPIEILFLDICKSAQLHDHATRMWFPRLIPGRSIVIQQDYGWWHYYVGNVMMEVFKDHFVTLDDVPVASRVYLCTKAISEAEAAEKVFAHLSADDKLRHMEAALKSVGQSEFRGNLLLNYALLAESLGRSDLVEHTLARILYMERADKVAPLAVTTFPQYFTGPERLALPEGMADSRLGLISQMSTHERLCLYSLVVSMQPQRVLEIGRARGGSTLVMADALKQVPGSRFVSMDPNVHPEHSISPALVGKLSPQVTFIDGFSPRDNPLACSAAQGKFDLVLIDANHYYEACLADIRGVVPFLSDNAVILLHDAHFLGVKEAIRTALEKDRGFIDCGLVSTAANYDLMYQKYLDQPSVFGGLHMLRFRADQQSRKFRLDGGGRFFWQKSGKRNRLPFFSRVRREWNRVLGRKK